MAIRQENGMIAEKKCAEFLRGKGFTVEETNCNGEQFLPFDLIATKNNITYAINVKSTQSDTLPLIYKSIKSLISTCNLLKYIPAYVFLKDNEMIFFKYQDINQL